MILEAGSKVLVVHRRLFEQDDARYFVGVVDGYEEGIVKVTGYSWIKDLMADSLVEKNEPRTKIFSITSGTLIVYLLPATLAVEKIRFENRNGELWLMGSGSSFQMNLSERGHARAKGHA